MLSVNALFSLWMMLFMSAVYASVPSESCRPQVIQKIESWDIISGNEADIPTSQAFSGKNITYSIEAQPHNQANKVAVNAADGKIKITADGKDNFDVMIKATNECGSSSITFNVQVDEEE